MIIVDLSKEKSIETALRTYKHKVQKTKELYTIIGAREACEKTMREHYQIALNALNSIKIEGEAKFPLIALADYLMVRNS